MILDIENKDLCLSEINKVGKFTIGNIDVILEILRSKTYKNPQRIICQEYMCNARDAHREIGKEDVPIVVHLPTIFEPVLKIQDFGPGISPERMEFVFIQYGCSTKRYSQKETGGFGIGAKSAWSYSDTFNISTIVDGKKYMYICPDSGDLTLVGDPQPTTEDNGTTIIIDIKRDDISTIHMWAYLTSEYWDVKPIFINEMNVPDNKKKSISEKALFESDYILYNTKHDRKEDTSYLSQLILCVDGIQYPCEKQALFKYKDDFKFSDVIFESNMIIFFNTGDVTHSASRESLHYNDKTCNCIINKLNDITKRINKKVDELISNCTSFLQAYDIVKKFINTIPCIKDILTNIKWNGFKIIINDDYFSGPIDHFFGYTFGHRNKPYKVIQYHNEHLVGGIPTIKRTSLDRLPSNIFLDGDVFINDTNTINPSIMKMRTVFLQHPDKKVVYVIHSEYSGKIDSLINKADVIGLRKLSLYENHKISRQKSKTQQTDIKPVLYLNGKGVYNTSKTIDIVNDSAIYLFYSKNRSFVNPNTSKIKVPNGVSTAKMLWDVELLFNIKICFISQQFASRVAKNKNMIHLSEYLDTQKNILEKQRDTNNLYYEVFRNSNTCYEMFKFIDFNDKSFRDCIKGNIFDDYIKYSDEIIQYKKNLYQPDFQKFAEKCHLLGIHPVDFHKPIITLQEYYEKIVEQYPLLSIIDTYRVSREPNKYNRDIYEYIQSKLSA